VLKDYPPTDLAGWKTFAQSLPVPEPFELVKDREPLGPIASYRFPANRRVLYSQLPRFPGGYLVAADAICSFNPIYGQGMSVALLTARALDDCLAQGFDGLTERFLQRAAATADSPWAIATGEDLRYPTVAGPRPFGFTVLSRYLERAHAAAARDPVVLRRFFEVASLLLPPTALLSPGIALRILLGGRGLASTGPANKLVAGPV
jgi:2-polyprenyl-6-methoxyphenol hydroxylase-like FAD-dependent oxidoreductase